MQSVNEYLHWSLLLSTRLTFLLTYFSFSLFCFNFFFHKKIPQVNERLLVGQKYRGVFRLRHQSLDFKLGRSTSRPMLLSEETWQMSSSYSWKSFWGLYNPPPPYPTDYRRCFYKKTCITYFFSSWQQWWCVFVFESRIIFRSSLSFYKLLPHFSQHQQNLVSTKQSAFNMTFCLFYFKSDMW